MTSYSESTRTQTDRGSRPTGDGSGAFLKVVALLLGIAVGVLLLAAVVLTKVADDARDDANASAVATDHSSHPADTSSNVSLPLESFAGKTAANRAAAAKPPRRRVFGFAIAAATASSAAPLR